MNTMKQDSTLLLGSREAISSLEEKESSKLLVISDSHGNPYNLIAAVTAFGKECDCLVFCGDGISDLTHLSDMAFSDEELKDSIPPVIAFVQGNNDTDMYPVQNPLYGIAENEPYFNQMKIPAVQNLRASSHNIFISHGHKYSLYSGTETLSAIAQNSGSDIVLYGHTHVANQTLTPEGITIVNPGSISRPRMSQPQAFAVIKLEKNNKYPEVIFYQLKGSAPVPFIPDGRMLSW